MSKNLDELLLDLNAKRKEVPVGSLWRHIKPTHFIQSKTL